MPKIILGLHPLSLFGFYKFAKTIIPDNANQASEL
jgi:hypothetical protein